MVSAARWIAALLSLCCAQAAAQQLYKCKDAAGKITYAGRECEDIGLRPAGEVKGRASVAPAYKPPAAAARPKPSAAAQDVPAAADAAKGPERRCFTVKTAKGTVTRCNDAPDEPKQ